MRWTMDSNSVNAIEFYNINVTLISELDHPDEKTNKGHIDLYGTYRDDFESKTYKVSIKVVHSTYFTRMKYFPNFNFLREKREIFNN